MHVKAKLRGDEKARDHRKIGSGTEARMTEGYAPLDELLADLLQTH